LDPNQLVEIRELIKKTAENKTVMLSTHILQEVEAICQRVIMINKGIIVTDGLTDNVRQGLNEKMTVIVEFKEVGQAEDICLIEGVRDYKMLSGKKWLLESEARQDIREDIFNFAKNKGLSILEMQTRKKSLEDSFRQLSQNDN
jgi:ABC-2 type transport system ATP-binding protein